MLVGNHEMGRNDLEISSAHLFALIPNVAVIDIPYMYNEQNNTSIMFLPYVLENNRKPLGRTPIEVELSKWFSKAFDDVTDGKLSPLREREFIKLCKSL
jgi:hypothetical protein